jgi:hypothetical protein
MTRKLIAVFATLFFVLSECAGVETKPTKGVEVSPEVGGVRNDAVSNPRTRPVTAPVSPAVVPERKPAPVKGPVKVAVVRQVNKYSLADCEGVSKKTSGYLCWRKVGGDPYQGNAAQALAQSGWPVEVQKRLLSNLEKEVKAEVKLNRGDVFDWMAFGKLLKDDKAKVRKNTIAAWPAGNEYPADVYSTNFKGAEYKLFRVGACGNFSGVAMLPVRISEDIPEEPPTQVATPAPVAPPCPVACPVVRVEEPEVWYRKSRVVVREIITEVPVQTQTVYSEGGGYAPAPSFYGSVGVGIGATYSAPQSYGYGGGGSNVINNISNVNNNANLNQNVTIIRRGGQHHRPVQVTPPGRIIGGGTLPPTTIGGGTRPPNTFGGGTLPPTIIGGGTSPGATFGGGTRPPNTFGGGTRPPTIIGGGTR